MFWFKKKKITLDCFTTDPFAFEFAKIAPAYQYYPDWWKSLPVESSNNRLKTNMRSCRGFTRYYKNSFVVPFWGHAEIKVGNLKNKSLSSESNYSTGFSQEHEIFVCHPREQYDNFVDGNFIQLKVLNSWICNTNRFVEFMVTDPIWNRKEITKYNIAPGIVDFKYQNALNINMMVEFRDVDRSIIFDPCDPIAMITPLTENEVDIKHHLIDPVELFKYAPGGRVVGLNKSFNHYSLVKKFIDKHEERNKPKCPFGFGK